MDEAQVHIHQVDFGTPAFDELLFLRNEILRIPLGLLFYEDDIAQEYDQIHFAAYSSQYDLMGCLVLHRKSNEVIKMRQVAVYQRFQKMGVGQQLVHYSETWAKDHAYNKITLNARDVAVPFYLKMGYKKIGTEFIEVNIKHWKLEKNL